MERGTGRIKGAGGSMERVSAFRVGGRGWQVYKMARRSGERELMGPRGRGIQGEDQGLKTA